MGMQMKKQEYWIIFCFFTRILDKFKIEFRSWWGRNGRWGEDWEDERGDYDDADDYYYYNYGWGWTSTIHQKTHAFGLNSQEENIIIQIKKVTKGE